MATTEQQRSVQHPWLMIVRGAAISLIGLLLFSFTEASHTAIGYGIGASLLVSGLCSVWFGTANRTTQEMVSWLIMDGLFAVVFGIVMLFHADGSATGFLDLIGFWALVFALLQAAQAVYSYIGPTGSTHDFPTKIMHIVLVITSAGLAYTVLLIPKSADGSLGLTGLLPIVMGGLLIVMVLRLWGKKTADAHSKPMVHAQ